MGKDNDDKGYDIKITVNSSHYSDDTGNGNNATQTAKNISDEITTIKIIMTKRRMISRIRMIKSP